jgi:hypothetical protein
MVSKGIELFLVYNAAAVLHLSFVTLLPTAWRFFESVVSLLFALKLIGLKTAGSLKRVGLCIVSYKIFPHQ